MNTEFSSTSHHDKHEVAGLEKKRGLGTEEEVLMRKTHVACHHEAVDARRVDDAELGNLVAGRAVLPSRKVSVHANIVQ